MEGMPKVVVVDLVMTFYSRSHGDSWKLASTASSESPYDNPNPNGFDIPKFLNPCLRRRSLEL